MQISHVLAFVVAVSGAALNARNPEDVTGGLNEYDTRSIPAGLAGVDGVQPAARANIDDVVLPIQKRAGKAKATATGAKAAGAKATSAAGAKDSVNPAGKATKAGANAAGQKAASPQATASTGAGKAKATGKATGGGKVRI